MYVSICDYCIFKKLFNSCSFEYSRRFRDISLMRSINIYDITMPTKPIRFHWKIRIVYFLYFFLFLDYLLQLAVVYEWMYLRVHERTSIIMLDDPFASFWENTPLDFKPLLLEIPYSLVVSVSHSEFNSTAGLRKSLKLSHELTTKPFDLLSSCDC